MIDSFVNTPGMHERQVYVCIGSNSSELQLPLHALQAWNRSKLPTLHKTAARPVLTLLSICLGTQWHPCFQAWAC